MKIRGAETKSESDQTQCWGEKPNSQMLRIEMRDGSFWLYPYGWLERVQFSPLDSEDRLIMIFGDREIRIIGKKLCRLGLLLQGMSVDWIKEIPERFNSLGSDEEAVVSAIEVAQKTKD